MIRPIAFVDLDDTLFQTLRKCPPDVPVERLVPLGFARDGSPLSYATPRQMALLAWLAQTARMIPVTARSLDALRRVRIDFTAAICAHGGVILDEGGAIDPVWAGHIADQAAAHAGQLETLAESVRGVAGAIPLTVRVLTEGDIGLYVLVKHVDADDRALHGVIDRMIDGVPHDWTIHRNGNNVALMPPFLGKRHAVAALLERLRVAHPDAPIIGIGDSITDAPYMGLCDFAMLPRGSQLAAATLDRLV